MPPRPRTLGVEQREEAWKRYKRGDGAKEIAAALAVPRALVQRYIDDGDPDQGVRPLRERMIKLAERAEEVYGFDDLQELTQLLKLLNGVTGHSAKALLDGLVAKTVTVRPTDIASLARAKREILMSLRAIRGEPTEVVRLTGEIAIRANTPKLVKELGGLDTEERRLLSRLVLREDERDENALEEPDGDGAEPVDAPDQIH